MEGLLISTLTTLGYALPELLACGIALAMLWTTARHGKPRQLGLTGVGLMLASCLVAAGAFALPELDDPEFLRRLDGRPEPAVPPARHRTYPDQLRFRHRTGAGGVGPVQGDAAAGGRQSTAAWRMTPLEWQLRHRS